MKELLISVLAAFLTSLALCLIILPILKKLKAGQYILGYVKEHSSKNGTPTMGGLAFIVSTLIITLIFCGVKNKAINLTLAITCAFGAVGFLDDFLKIYRKNNGGLKPYQKIFFQLAISIIAALYCYFSDLTTVFIPFSFGLTLNISVFIIPLVVITFLATVNCVNLTDGLDGLASTSSIVYLIAFAIISTLQGEKFYLPCAVMCASLAAFLLFNTNKASVFMGDTGSLALGGFISCVSIFSGNTLLIPFLGITFVISGISVIVQVIYYKQTGKRVFLMAPYHHHLQKKGLSEAKISYIYAVITALVGIVLIIFV